MSQISTSVLNKDILLRYMNDIIVIEKDTSLALGEAYGLPWTAENLLFEMPGKWHYSSIAFVDSKSVGYLIVSSWRNNVHVHRNAIATHLNGHSKVNIAKALYERTNRLARGDGRKYVSVIVPATNESTKRFYLREGFELLDNSNLNWFVEGKKFPGYISNNLLIDNDSVEGEPSVSYVFRFKYQ